jgi:hypothetical protein
MSPGLELGLDRMHKRYPQSSVPVAEHTGMDRRGVAIIAGGWSSCRDLSSSPA